jgi:L-ribulokinase
MARVEGRRYALGLDFGTESVRAVAVDAETGDEAAFSVVPYASGVITENLPPDFALQNPDDYVDSGCDAIREVLEVVPAGHIIGIGVDFTACTILPILHDGTPLMRLERFREDPHAWVKLWKHHAAQPEADLVNELARRRGEPFMKYYSGLVSSEWMLPKCWEVARHAPDVYAATEIFIDAGDWVVHQITGRFTRNSCAAGYKGLWNADLGFPSRDFLGALDPAIRDLDDKWLKNIVQPGRCAGTVTRAFSDRSGLAEGTPVSAATIDAHSGVAGMGVCREGPVSLIMGTSTCHMVLSKELRFFDGYAGVVKDGIIPGVYGYESGQSAVGDIFGWFVREFAGGQFEEISAKAAALKPGVSGLVALDWLNGSRSVLMNSNLTGMVLGLTLDSRPEELYRAWIEATAFGTRKIVDAHVNAGIPATELVVCGGLVKDPLIMQIYADVTGLPVKVAASSQAVALGAAIFGALAATDPGDDSQLGSGSYEWGVLVEELISRMTRPPATVYHADPKVKSTYDRLYNIYLHAHDHFGREHSEVMKSLKEIARESRDA